MSVFFFCQNTGNKKQKKMGRKTHRPKKKKKFEWQTESQQYAHYEIPQKRHTKPLQRQIEKNYLEQIEIVFTIMYFISADGYICNIKKHTNIR